MNMMPLSAMARCLRTSRVLQHYLDGETDDLTAARVAEHLEECRRCGLQARTYQAIKQALRSGSRDVDDLALRRLRAFSHSLAEHDGPGAAG
jgi:anti-sigma factor RsiW